MTSLSLFDIISLWREKMENSKSIDSKRREVEQAFSQFRAEYITIKKEYNSGVLRAYEALLLLNDAQRTLLEILRAYVKLGVDEKSTIERYNKFEEMADYFRNSLKGQIEAANDDIASDDE